MDSWTNTKIFKAERKILLIYEFFTGVYLKPLKIIYSLIPY